MYNGKYNYCNNCGKIGHTYKKCLEPITSLGIICIKIDINGLNNFLKSINQNKVDNDFFLNTNQEVNILRLNLININNIKYYNELKKYIYFLLISRKASLGFMEIIRGHYDKNNKNSFIKLYKQLYKEEVELIKNNDFDYLWKYIWQINIIENDSDYLNSKNKLNYIKDNDIFNYCIDNIPLLNINHEWGFPKGRRSNMEKNIECAIREFKEETSLKDENFKMINNIQPITENLIGTNNVNYKHIYYFAYCDYDINVEINKKNKLQFKEVGNIDWFNYDDVIKLIRNYHLEKKIIINNIYIHICNLILNN